MHRIELSTVHPAITIASGEQRRPRHPGRAHPNNDAVVRFGSHVPDSRSSARFVEASSESRGRHRDS